MELELENTEVVSANNIQIEAPGSVEVIEGEKDYEVSVVKKEYTIIGDSIFIPSMYEDAPPWLKEFIDTTLEVAITNRDQSLIDRMEAILTLMDYVPKNMYTEQINQIVSEDGIINSRIATLNSNLTDAISSTNATVAEINLTYASKNEAAAIATNVITASLSGNGEIGSALIQLQEAYADLESTTAQSISMLESVMEGEINGNARAMETIRTYVGIDEAGASTGTGLSAYLEASDGTIGGADSQLANTIRVTAEGVESKFAYNSVVNINGIYKKSGFGLTTNYTSGTGTEANPYVSEFWIDASRLKFTNSNQTGQTAPFTIDATGTTPQITFNGKVAFTNVTGTSSLALTDMSNVTTIDGGKITTGSITAAQINANAISGKIISGGTITGTSIYGSYIEGAIIKASFIDLTSTQTLTNWQQYTPSNYPSAYANNFAHKNDGTLLVDSLGYVRLMGNTNIVTQQLTYQNNYSGTTFPLSLPTYSVDLYAYSDYTSNTLNRCITATPTLSIPVAQKIIFCSLTTSTGDAQRTSSTLVRCYINNDYYEISANGTVASNSLSYSFTCSIKKNGVVIGSSSSISGVTHTAYIGNLPILVSVGASWSYGLYPVIRVETVNTLSSSTNINYTGVYGKAFQLSYAYSSNRMYSSINVPAITVNG